MAAARKLIRSGPLTIELASYGQGGERARAVGRGRVSPNRSAFAKAERAVIESCRTPRAVQRWLRALPYNMEKRGETLRSFRGVVQHGIVHCLEAALCAATILEQHGYPTLLLSFESVDQLDHVIYPFRARNGLWGAVARSRDPGLHGRRPAFRGPRELAASYLEPYVDFTGRVTGYAVADLRELGDYDWRLSERNVWRVEQWLIGYTHRRLEMSERRYRELLDRYRRYRTRYPDRKPVYYADRHTWM